MSIPNPKWTLSLAGLTLIAAGVVATRGQEPLPGQPGKRAQFMRQKLEFSKDILDGLTREDYGLVATGARKLRLLSQASEWEDPIMPDPAEYLRHSAEFQRLTSELGAKARDRNIDGATLAYVQLTMNCIACHKYVRQIKK
jgi:hypothetical protein